jgi:iron-sulfur cluster assembly protein
MITVTPRAARKAAELADKKGVPRMLRVGVRGGGCSGYAYVLEFVSQSRASDRRIDAEEMTIIVDPKSLEILDGTILDFEQNLLKGGFKFKNPRAKKTCGCGESFAA